MGARRKNILRVVQGTIHSLVQSAAHAQGDVFSSAGRASDDTTDQDPQSTLAFLDRGSYTNQCNRDQQDSGALKGTGKLRQLAKRFTFSKGLKLNLFLQRGTEIITSRKVR